jgi:hypothetical protein
VGGRGGIGDYFALVLLRSPQVIGDAAVEELADRTRVSVSGKAGVGLFGASASIRGDRQTLQDGTVSVSERSEAGTVGAKAEATVDLRIFGPPVSDSNLRFEVSGSLGLVGATVTLLGTGNEPPKINIAVKAGPQIGFTLKGPTGPLPLSSATLDALKTPVTGGIGGRGLRVDVAGPIERAIERAIEGGRSFRQCTEEGCR